MTKCCWHACEAEAAFICAWKPVCRDHLVSVADAELTAKAGERASTVVPLGRPPKLMVAPEPENAA